MHNDCHFMISIHAPTRGATLLMPKLWHKKRISIHAPTRGATLSDNKRDIFISISIHAPTRGATLICLRCHCSSQFQSTLPREERPTIGTLGQFPVLFQSTLPREERLLLQRCALIRALFQSTLPREERPNSVPFFVYLCISIHAPTRGATFDYYYFN